MTHDQLIADAMRELTDSEQLALMELELSFTINACANDRISGEDAWRIIKRLASAKIKQLESQT